MYSTKAKSKASRVARLVAGAAMQAIAAYPCLATYWFSFSSRVFFRPS
jgi:hypothetical protein